MRPNRSGQCNGGGNGSNDRGSGGGPPAPPRHPFPQSGRAAAPGHALIRVPSRLWPMAAAGCMVAGAPGRAVPPGLVAFGSDRPRHGAHAGDLVPLRAAACFGARLGRLTRPASRVCRWARGSWDELLFAAGDAVRRRCATPARRYPPGRFGDLAGGRCGAHLWTGPGTGELRERQLGVPGSNPARTGSPIAGMWQRRSTRLISPESAEFCGKPDGLRPFAARLVSRPRLGVVSRAVPAEWGGGRRRRAPSEPSPHPSVLARRARRTGNRRPGSPLGTETSCACRD
jgi:hypothetical protein